MDTEEGGIRSLTCKNIHGNTGFGDIGGNDNLADTLANRREDAVLLLGSKGSMQGHNIQCLRYCP